VHTEECKIAHASNLSAVTQEASTVPDSGHTGPSHSRKSLHFPHRWLKQVEVDGMGRLSFRLALLFDFPIFLLFFSTASNKPL
jgi:hypothetical protein